MRFVIACTQRTGSNALCEALASTHIAGIPDVDRGHFFIGYDDLSRENWYQRTESYFDSVRGPNNVEGCKLGWDYIEDYLQRLCGFPVAVELLGSVDHFIYLTREDIVAQAVSWEMARQTGRWSSRDTAKTVPIYSAVNLAFIIARIEAQRAHWEAWFREMHIKPFRVSYEQLSADWLYAVRDICFFLGLELAHDWRPRLSLARLNNPQKEDWIATYKKSQSGRVRRRAAHRGAQKNNGSGTGSI